MITRRQALALGATAAGAHLLPIFDAHAALVYSLKPQSLADGAFLVSGVPEAVSPVNGGAIANVVIFDTSDGAVVIDTGPSRRFGEALAMLAKDLTGKPVVRAYVTHFHPDHAFGNQAFGASAIAAPKGVIDGLAKTGKDFSSAMYAIAGDWMRGTEVVLPGIIVSEGVEEIGGRKFHLMDLKGHTGSDLALYEERSGLLITGDLVFLDRAPTTPHADLPQWRDSLKRLETVDHALLVPGHGPAETGARGLGQTRDWLAAVESIIRDAFERGLDIGEVVQLPLPEWTGKVALARYEFERTVNHFYPKLEAGLLPAVGSRR